MTDDELAQKWSDAIALMEVRHPDRRSRAVLRVERGSPPSLHVALENAHSTVDDALLPRFKIASVALSYFPGEALAQQWLAAAWVGYLQHEALELVRAWCFTDAFALEMFPVLDPHAEPYQSNPYNRGLRDGFPPVLTSQTLLATLRLVMDDRAARELTGDWSW